MGYTPAFDSLYAGTLYGKWPSAAVWASLLPLINKHGVIDFSYEAIAGMTGWPMDLLRQGIQQLMEPDLGSRSKLEDGRRLVLLDPERPWGWRVVNAQKYRDKASGADQVSDGRNAEKVRKYKERHRKTPEDTAGHSETPETPTHTHTHTHTETKEREKRRATRCPSDFIPDLSFALKEIPDIDAEREAQKFKDWEFKSPRSDWGATWRNWIRGCKDAGKYAKKNGGIKWQ